MTRYRAVVAVEFDADSIPQANDYAVGVAMAAGRGLNIACTSELVSVTPAPDPEQIQPTNRRDK